MSKFCGFIDRVKEPEKQIELNVENILWVGYESVAVEEVE